MSRRSVIVAVLSALLLAFAGAGILKLRTCPPERLEIRVVDERGEPMPGGSVSVAELEPGRWVPRGSPGRLDAEGRLEMRRPYRRFYLSFSWPTHSYGPVTAVPGRLGETLLVRVKPEDLRKARLGSPGSVASEMASWSSGKRVVVPAPLPAPYEGDLVLYVDPAGFPRTVEVEVKSWGNFRSKLILHEEVPLEPGCVSMRLQLPRIHVPWQVRVDGQAMRRLEGEHPLRLTTWETEQLALITTLEPVDDPFDASISETVRYLSLAELQRLRELAVTSRLASTRKGDSQARRDRALVSAGATRESLERALEGPFVESIAARLERHPIQPSLHARRRGETSYDPVEVESWYRRFIEEHPPAYEDLLNTASRALRARHKAPPPVSLEGYDSWRIVQIPGVPWIAIHRPAARGSGWRLFGAYVDGKAWPLTDVPLHRLLHELDLVELPPPEPWGEDVWTWDEFVNGLHIWHWYDQRDRLGENPWANH